MMAVVIDTQRVAKRIKRWRHHRALTQESAAERADVSRVTWARIEAGEASPRLGTIQAIARALDVSISTLLDIGVRRQWLVTDASTYKDCEAAQAAAQESLGIVLESVLVDGEILWREVR